MVAICTLHCYHIQGWCIWKALRAVPSSRSFYNSAKTALYAFFYVAFCFLFSAGTAATHSDFIACTASSTSDCCTRNANQTIYTVNDVILVVQDVGLASQVCMLSCFMRLQYALHHSGGPHLYYTYGHAMTALVLLDRAHVVLAAGSSSERWSCH